MLLRNLNYDFLKIKFNYQKRNQFQKFGLKIYIKKGKILLIKRMLEDSVDKTWLKEELLHL